MTPLFFIGCGDTSNINNPQNIVENNTSEQLDLNTTEDIIENNTSEQLDLNITEEIVENNTSEQLDLNTTEDIIENNTSEQLDTNETQTTLSYELQNYYADVLVNNGDDLKDTLHMILLDSAIYLTYAEDYELMSKTDKDYINPNEDNVILFYLQRSESADSKCHSISTECWNREHMWPKSLGVGYDSSISTYTDLHHLRPSDASVNSFRGNKPYGEAFTPYDVIDGFYSDVRFEVSDELKGDVARAILYMMVRYEGDNNEPDLEIYANNFSDKYPAELCTMLKWNLIDPVTSADRRRNDIVQQYQGNRNPFVDDPSWADTIWGWECQDNL